MQKKLISSFLCVLLSGCTAGPDYHKPEISLPEKWQEALPTGPKTAQENPYWWQDWQDPVLNGLLEQLQKANLDLKSARSRMMEAKAQWEGSKSAFWPHGQLMMTPKRQRNLMALPGLRNTKAFSTYSAQAAFNWNLDICGKHHRASEAALAQLEKAAASYEQGWLVICHEFIQNYVTFRLMQQQLRVIKQLLDVQEEMLALMEQRLLHGAVTPSEVLPLKEGIHELQSQEATLKTTLIASQRALECLLGQQPGALQQTLETPHALPFIQDPPLLQAPAHILQQVPQIHMAERQLAASTALKGVAMAALYPDVSLSSLLGWLSASRRNLLTQRNTSWAFEGDLNIPFLNFGAIMAQIDQADQQQQQAFLEYKKAILTTLQEIETYLSTYVQDQQRYHALQTSLETAEELYQLEEVRQQAGLTDRLTLLLSYKQLIQANLTALAAQADVARTVSGLYKSMGGRGRWTEERPSAEEAQNAKQPEAAKTADLTLEANQTLEISETGSEMSSRPEDSNKQPTSSAEVDASKEHTGNAFNSTN